MYYSVLGFLPKSSLLRAPPARPAGLFSFAALLPASLSVMI